MSTEAATEPTAAVPPLAPESQALVLAAFKPLERLFRPLFFGAENIPTHRPLFFIGNHQLLSLDVPFLIAELWRREIAVRGLGDDFLFVVPALAAALRHTGVVPASPETAATLLQRGESLLVYPGGAREASKNAGHKDLDWIGRFGFARVALQQGCTIVPVAATGVDNRFEILLSPERYLHSPLGRAVDALGLRRDMFLPFMLPTGRPRPAFHFCPPIYPEDTSLSDLTDAASELHSKTAKAIEVGMQVLKQQLRDGNGKPC